MRESHLAATKNFGLLFCAQFLRIITQQLAPVLLKPKRQPLPFLRRETEDCVFELLHAHVLHFSKSAPAGDWKSRLASQTKQQLSIGSYLADASTVKG